MRASLRLPVAATAAVLALSTAFPSQGTPGPETAPVLTPADRLHIQFTGPLEVPDWATAVEVDGEDTPAATVASLRSRGLKTICYLSAGSWERYRDDAQDFPKRLIGRKLDGWPKERWLDVRKRKALRPLIEDRLQQCVDKGFQGVEFDNVDGYQNRTGFDISRRQQLRYNTMLARLAHSAGLSPGLKNAVGLTRPLSEPFDWALNEECVTYGECGRYRPFMRKGKSVTILEYGDRGYRRVCRTADRLGAFAQMKRLSLSAWSRPC